LNVFKGMWPRRSRQQLPPEGSELSVNCDLLSGDLRAIRGGFRRKDFTSGQRLRMAFRIPASFRSDVSGQPPASEYDDDDVWFASDNDYTHFVKGPLVNDKYDRFYWTKPGDLPRYASLAQLIAGGTDRDGADPTLGGSDPYYILGVPRPPHTDVDIFTVVASGGTNDLKETRCYVYTFINVFGEESAPSLPVCAEGNGDGTWTLNGLKTAFEEPWASEGAPLGKKRIYRTVTGVASASFFFVDEIDVADTTYVDDIPTDEVSLNVQLDSDAWETPPSNLIGIVRHPNGFLVGFEDGGDLRFSDPNRPHAWPVEYALSTEGDIQALGIFGQSVVAATNAHPYVATGTNPAGISLVKSDTSSPCVSRNSLVSFESGVVFASPSGITSVGASGLSVVSEQLVSAGEWRDRYDPAYIHATRDGNQYLGFSIYEDQTLERRGLIFAPRDSVSVWSEVSFRLQQTYETLQTDIYNGDVLAIANNLVYAVNEPLASPLEYSWRSTEFVTAKPCNFGAFRIDFDQVIRYPEQSPELENLEQYLDDNRKRMTRPLDTLDLYPIDGVRRGDTYDPPFVLMPELKQPIGGSPLYDILAIGRATVSVLLYGDRVLRYSNRLTEPGRYRFPEGYKSDLWQVEFRGNADLHHFKMAETGKELANV